MPSLDLEQIIPKVRFKKLKVEKHKRLCTLYNENKLGDEYHILF